jgi:glycosyltransferase involved in cell wall biosynthesis
MRAMCEQVGIRCLAETDDNYMGNMRYQPYLRWTWDKQRALMHLKMLCSGDGIIFSTARLRDMYWREIRDHFGKLDLELHVCGNHVPDHDWPEPVPRTGPVRVGWMGSPSHDEDLDLILPALDALLQSRLDVEVVIVGHLPRRPGWLRLASHRRFRHIPWVDPEEYGRPALPLDVGLIPLHWSTMSAGKSDVKAIEYTISGAAVVAQNVPIYSDTWKHGETCLLAGSKLDFLREATRLVKDESLRERLVRAAREYVRSERGTKRIKEEWGAALNI